MPAAVHVTSNTAVHLLDTAIRRANVPAVKVLVGLPAAQQLSSEAVTALLKAAANRWYRTSVILAACFAPCVPCQQHSK
jgi:hypothetical protein